MNVKETTKAMDDYCRLFKRTMREAAKYQEKNGVAWSTIGQQSCMNPRIFERIMRGTWPDSAILKRMLTFLKGAKHGK